MCGLPLIGMRFYRNTGMRQLFRQGENLQCQSTPNPVKKSPPKIDQAHKLWYFQDRNDQPTYQPTDHRPAK